MDFTCPVCGEVMTQELAAIVAHGENHVVDEIKKKHPKWVQGDNVCTKCYQYYKDQLHPANKAKRSKISLLKENVLKHLKPNKKKT